MISCNGLIQMLHDIVNTLPVTHDVPNMISLLQSIIKVLNIYLGQCFTTYSI